MVAKSPPIVADVFALHPLRHHFTHSVKGILRATPRVVVAVPCRLPRDGLRAIRLFSPRLFSTLAHYSYDFVPPEQMVAVFSSIGFAARRFLDQAAMARAFDLRCASMIQRGTVKARFCHILQDYLPLTVAAAREKGMQVVVEQIIASPEQARLQMREVAREFGYTADKFGLAPTETANTAILAAARAVICPSRIVMDAVGGRCAARKEMIPYGVDVLQFKPSVKPDPSHELRIAARANSFRKGVAITIAGFLELARSKVWACYPGSIRIDFIGELELSTRTSTLLAELRTNPRIVITEGHRTRADVADLLGHAHLLLMPSFAEGMSLAVCEAVAAGAVPVISHNCGFDAIQDGESGRIISPLTSAGVCQALKSILEAPANLAVMAIKAQAALANRTWFHFENDIGKLYEGLLGD